MAIVDDLAALQTETLAAIEAAADSAALEQVRVGVLGKSGSLTGYLRGMGQVPKEERAEVGKTVNAVRVVVEDALAARKAALASAELEASMDANAVDITLPGRYQQLGTRHLINRIIDEISEIFLGLGYSIAKGPEVETEYYNFNALNAPEDHPSRGLADTFYVVDRSDDAHVHVKGESGVLLRTQTSPVQARVMEAQKPPIYIISPGKVYRRDVADPSHLPQFHQIEGLVVDEGITMGDLKGALETLIKRLYGEDAVVRFRPHHFPFTEPSCEVDMQCFKCHGTGETAGQVCSTCHGEGWIELLGAGMVHPKVLAGCGIDPEIYSGFAFGIGLERMAMRRFKISDMRMIFENDIRFLSQF